MTRAARLDRALAEIKPGCDPTCQVVTEDTNHFHTEHALGCPVWLKICAEREEDE